jgi:hypothetical protein
LVQKVLMIDFFFAYSLPVLITYGFIAG